MAHLTKSDDIKGVEFAGVGRVGGGYMGVGAPSSDGLALDLQFAADKTLTARKGPTPAFTRGSTGTFVGSDGLIQSAAINTPRFDHTSAGVCRGLLIEEGRTNLFARSEELGNAYWTISNASISGIKQTSPNGSLTADTITASAGTPSLYRAVACTASTLYTFSFYIKIGTLTPSDFKFAVRDDTNGVFIADNIVPNVTPVTTEWRRVTYTFTTPVGCVLVRPYLMRYSYLAAGTIYLWGAQLEAGSFPTSYIPTTTGTLARGADVCNITGGNFSGFYNQSEGTLFLNAVSPFESQLAYPLMVNTTANSQAHRIARTNEAGLGSKRWRALTTTSAGIEAVITTSGDITTTNVKAAYAFKLNDNAFAVNNVLVGTDTTVTMPNPTSMRIGGNDGVDVLNGHIAAVRFYKKRLPDAKLAQLTA
jgi:hypothetical protein